MASRAWQGSRYVVGVLAIGVGCSLLACGGIMERGSETNDDSLRDGAKGDRATDGNPTGYGTLQVRLQPVSGLHFEPVVYSVYGAAGGVLSSGVVAVPNDETEIRFSLSLPQGNNYTLVASTATAETGDEIDCDATVVFDVRATSTSDVLVVMICRDNSTGGPLIQPDIDND